MPHKHENFLSAFEYANEKHREHTRKGSNTPYISHPMAVAALVMENDGTAEEVMAALLHDVLEDCREVTRDDIAARFGERVADIVESLSDANPGPGEAKAPWEERKRAYIALMESTPDMSVIKVSNADKLHNARSILTDLLDPAVGEQLWERFQASKEESLWYYETLSRIFDERSPSPKLAAELRAAVAQIRHNIER